MHIVFHLVAVRKPASSECIAKGAQ